MIQHVYEQVARAHNLSNVVVATDDKRIAEAIAYEISKVLPFKEIETETPCNDFPILPLPTSFKPSRVQTPAARLNIHAPPTLLSFPSNYCCISIR